MSLIALVRRSKRDQNGATIVEFALISPVLMLMIVGIVELGLMLAAQTIMDNATFSAARVGKTGYSTSQNSQDQLILAAVKKAASSYLDPAKIALTSKAYTDYGNIGKPEPFTDTNNNGVRDAGESFTDVNGNGSWDKDQGASGPGTSAQIVVYKASYDWRIITPFMKKFIGTNGVYTVTSQMVVKNEPY